MLILLSLLQQEQQHSSPPEALPAIHLDALTSGYRNLRQTPCPHRAAVSSASQNIL